MYKVKMVFSCPVDVACKDNKSPAWRIAVGRSIEVSRSLPAAEVSHIMMGWKEGNTDPFMEDLRCHVY